MAMILKIMKSANVPDDNPYAEYDIHHGVRSVSFSNRPDAGPTGAPDSYWSASAFVSFENGTNHRFDIPANAYLMNEQGKTISHFSPKD